MLKIFCGNKYDKSEGEWGGYEVTSKKENKVWKEVNLSVQQQRFKALMSVGVQMGPLKMTYQTP